MLTKSFALLFHLKKSLSHLSGPLPIYLHWDFLNAFFSFKANCNQCKTILMKFVASSILDFCHMSTDTKIIQSKINVKNEFFVGKENN